MVQTERQVAATFMAAGAKDVVLPTFETARAEFDAALLAAPDPVDMATTELRQLLGVA